MRRAGYDAVPDAGAPAREMRRAESRRMLWRLFVAVFCSMQVMMLATPAYVAGRRAALGGAGVMAAFAAGSSIGLAAGPALWWRVTGGKAALATPAPTWALRVAGAGLAAAAAFALGHGAWQRVAAWCFG